MIDPAAFAVSETLRNGLVVTIRALRPDDRERIAQAVGRLDRESIYLRLFSYRRELTQAGLDRIMHSDPEREVVLVATVDGGGRETVVASGRYVTGTAAEGRPAAEIAFMVEEDYNGLGIAGRLLGHLAGIARAKGITAFDADVLAGNKAMLAVLARSGLTMHKRQDGSVVHVTLSLQPESPRAAND